MVNKPIRYEVMKQHKDATDLQGMLITPFVNNTVELIIKLFQMFKMKFPLVMAMLDL